MSLQPWGYAKRYSEDAKGSKDAQKIFDTINDRLSDHKLMAKTRDKNNASSN
jgi:hypothetical protein